MDNGVDYVDTGCPVPVANFIRYGQWFQKSLVPHVEDLGVVSLCREDDYFRLGLADGTSLAAARVVLAVGMASFAYVPSALARLAPERVSHTVDHHNLTRFSGRRIAVLGAGQSALETAALLRESGADVHVLVRGPGVTWGREPVDAPPLLRRLRYPASALGAGWRIRFYAEAPDAFRRMPPEVRARAVRAALGPAGSWWLRDRVEGRIPVSVNCHVEAARVIGDCVQLTVQRAGETSTLQVDHVIAGTGYRVHPAGLSFLDRELTAEVRTHADYPVLNKNFESSVPGLHWVGLAAAGTFGPVQRFVAGSRFAAHRLAAAVTRSPRPSDRS